MKKLFFTALLLAVLPGAQARQNSTPTQTPPQRIIAMSPDVTDILVALGAANQIVGRDQTTTNPAVQHIRSIGIFRQLSVEPIVALRPTLAIGSWMVQPPGIYANLNRLGIKAVNVAPDNDINAYPASVRQVGQLTGKSREADVLAARWQAGMGQLPNTGKRYLLSYDGRLVAGRNTAADELIRRAGGINAAANIDGIKPLSREAWIAAKPDVIIISEHNRNIIGSVQQFAARPEVASSPAAKNRNIHLWPANDFFRYGLDTPQVLRRLHNLGK